MIKLFTLKQQRKDEQRGGSGGGDKDKVPGKPSTSAAQIRIQKDIAELSLPKTMKISFPNPDDLLNFELEIRPDEGFYYRGKFLFTFNIKSSYPHDPPKVLCKQKIYHPNIDLDGNICLNILREDWKPVLNLNAVIYGLSFLFLEPNPDDPLNKEAAQVLRTHRSQFESNVKTSMAGGRIGNEKYDNVLL